MTALSVTVDGRSLTDASSYRGLGTYVRQLLAGLAEVPELDLSVLAEPAGPLPPRAGRIPITHRAPDRWATAEHQFLLSRRLAELSRQAARAGATAAGGSGATGVFHSPALDPPRRVRLPWVQTIADVLPLADPHPAYAVERRRWGRWAGRIRAADAVIALSRHSAGQAADLLGVAPDRVHVIPLAADPHYRPIEAEINQETTEGPYLLSVGEYAPHKGFSELGLVMRDLARAGLPHRLIVAGRVTDQWRPEMEKALRSGGSEARGRIEVIGWVPDLLSLYQGAAALVCTSRHEGFGLPLVEAMATATPVVAFANSAVPEVVGNGGVLVADGDCAAMAARLAEMLGDPTLRARAAAAARTRAGCFSWAETVRAHVQLYRRVAGLPA